MPGKQRKHTRVSKHGKIFEAGRGTRFVKPKPVMFKGFGKVKSFDPRNVDLGLHGLERKQLTGTGHAKRTLRLWRAFKEGKTLPPVLLMARKSVYAGISVLDGRHRLALALAIQRVRKWKGASNIKVWAQVTRSKKWRAVLHK